MRVAALVEKEGEELEPRSCHRLAEVPVEKMRVEPEPRSCH
jgi:hypothetical protein